MNQFIYAIRPDQMAGLDTILDPGLMDKIRKPFNMRSAANGPAGACILVTAGEAGDCLYKPDDQDWIKSIVGDYWIGTWNGRIPTEMALRKTSQLSGHRVTLADGSEWLVPVVRLIDGGSALPASLVLGTKGEVYTSELPAYSKLSAQADQLFADLRVEMKWDEGTQVLGPGDRIGVAADAMGWNYHIGVDEMNILGLLTTKNLSDVMAAILDIPSIKKKINAAADD